MILLSVQIQCILYHLLAGWIYGLCFSFLQTLTQYYQKNMLTVLSEILFHAAFSAGMFFGLLFVNGAVSNIYLVLFFMLGVFFYYRFYYRLFYHFFTFVRHFFHKRFHKIAVAKSRMLGIIKRTQKRVKKGGVLMAAKKRRTLTTPARIGTLFLAGSGYFAHIIRLRK